MYFRNMLNITMYKTLIQNYNDKSLNLKIANFKKFYNVNNNTTTTSNNYYYN